MNMKTLISTAAVAVVISTAFVPASAGLIGGKNEVKPVHFDAKSADAGVLTRADKLDILRGTKAVVIAQFTVEFVDRSTGLSMKHRDGAVAVNYSVAGLDDGTAQTIVDRLYDIWVTGLQAQGISVKGPDTALELVSWNRGISALAKPTPAMIDTPMGRNRIFAARATPYYFLDGERDAAQSGAEKTVSGLAGMVPFGGMAKGLMGMGKGLKTGGAALGEMRLAEETAAAVMRVRLVVGIRESDRPSQLFAALRSGDAFIGEPRFTIEGAGSRVDVTTYIGKAGQAAVTVPADLLFAQNLLSDHLTMNDSAAATASNVAARGLFLAGAVSSSFGGAGGINLKQSHNVAATPDKAALADAVGENLTATQTMFLKRLSAAW